MRHSRRTAGFTLMEMMIVIVVMGLLLTLILTNRPETSPTLSLRATTSRIAQTLRLARTNAIATDRPVTILINPKSRSFGTTAKQYHFPAGILLEAPAQPITFQPDGSATSGAITVGIKRMRSIVTVHWLTGQVSIGKISG